MADDLAPNAKFRRLTGAAAALARFFLCTLTILGALWSLELHDTLEWTFFKEQYLGLFFAIAMAGIFLYVKSGPTESSTGIPWYDWMLAGASLLAGGYVTIMYPTIAYRLGVLSPERWLLGGMTQGLLADTGLSRFMSN